MSPTFFGISATAGFLFSGFYLWKRAREEHLPETEIFDVYIVISLWVILISRIASIVLNFDKFGFDPIRWLSIFTLPGLDGLTGLITAVVMVILAAMKRHWDIWVGLDVFLPAIMIWQSFLTLTIQWPIAVIWGVFSVLLWWTEREYRFWNWYRGRRANTRPGLVAAFWLMGEGVGFTVLALFANHVLFLALGISMLITAVIVTYQRSGRMPKSDLMVFVNAGSRLSKIFSARKPKQTI